MTTEEDNNGYLSFVSLSADNKRILINDDYSLVEELPEELVATTSKKKWRKTTKEQKITRLESLIIAGCQRYGVDVPGDDTARICAIEVVQQMYERRAQVAKKEEEEDAKQQAEPDIELTEDLKKEVSWKEISEILSTSIKKDNAPKLITFNGMLLSKTNDDQLNIAFQAESSTGKSYIPLEVATYFPKNEIEIIASASPTAFFHDSGKWDAEKKELVVDLRGMNMIFLDMPHFQLLEKMRPMLSHDDMELRYKITDKNQRHGLRTKNVVLKGPASFFFCSAKADPDEQEKTRMILLSPETDEEKLKESLKLLNMKRSNPEEYNIKIRQDKGRIWLQDRIKGIRQWGIREVIIPDSEKTVYDRFLQEHPHLIPRHQRDLPRLISFIKAHALLNCFNRQKNNDSEKTIVANQVDIDAGFELYKEIEESNELGLSPFIFRIYKTVIEPMMMLDEGEGLCRDAILRKYYQVMHKSLSPHVLNKDILPQLEAVGLIREEPDPIDRRRMLIYPTVSSHISRYTGNDSGVAKSTEEIFWEKFTQLEAQHQEGKVSESMLRQELISTGKFTAGEATQAIKDAIYDCKIQKLDFDVLCRKKKLSVGEEAV